MIELPAITNAGSLFGFEDRCVFPVNWARKYIAQCIVNNLVKTEKGPTWSSVENW